MTFSIMCVCIIGPTVTKAYQVRGLEDFINSGKGDVIRKIEKGNESLT